MKKYKYSATKIKTFRLAAIFKIIVLLLLLIIIIVIIVVVLLLLL